MSEILSLFFLLGIPVAVIVTLFAAEKWLRILALPYFLMFLFGLWVFVDSFDWPYNVETVVTYVGLFIFILVSALSSYGLWRRRSFGYLAAIVVNGLLIVAPLISIVSTLRRECYELNCVGIEFVWLFLLFAVIYTLVMTPTLWRYWKRSRTIL